jgi:hypothetical protein
MCRGCRKVVKLPAVTHIPTQDYNITQSSVPDDGHMVARNMLSNY